MADAKHTPEWQHRADAQLNAYRSAQRRYVVGRRDAAVLLAADTRLSQEQAAYWNYLADGFDAIAKATGSAS